MRKTTHQPRGAFDSIWRAPSASNLGLNKSKRTPRHHNKKDPRGGSSMGLNTQKGSIDINDKH